MKPTLILINPWIYDFAAYDMWSKPLGLLYVAGFLRECGFDIQVVDCMDVHATGMKEFSSQAHPVRRLYGTGKFWRKEIPKPAPLAHINRTYSRYGIAKQLFIQKLLKIEDPSAILVTSLMTYWYPGVRETIRIIKENRPDATIILGGIYATLCREHAIKFSGADMVVSGECESSIISLVSGITGFNPTLKFTPGDFDSYPFPAFGLQRNVSYVPLLTSKGCPFSCVYCASGFLNPKRMLKTPDRVIDEIKYWKTDFGVRDFVFYDDALLFGAENHALLLFEKIVQANIKVRFHTPNAVHIREIGDEIARLMKMSGFKTIRLGLETAGFDDRLDRKVTVAEFMRASSSLIRAGFQKDQIGAYLLVGLPGQKMNEIADSIKLVKQSGITPIPAYYSPIPHTILWKKAVAGSRYDLESDPVFTNNSILPCREQGFSWDFISSLKQLVSSG